MENRDIENAPALVVKLIFPNAIELLSILVGKREHISDTKRKKQKNDPCLLLVNVTFTTFVVWNVIQEGTYILLNKQTHKQTKRHVYRTDKASNKMSILSNQDSQEWLISKLSKIAWCLPVLYSSPDSKSLHINLERILSS